MVLSLSLRFRNATFCLQKGLYLHEYSYEVSLQYEVLLELSCHQLQQNGKWVSKKASTQAPKKASQRGGCGIAFSGRVGSEYQLEINMAIFN